MKRELFEALLAERRAKRPVALVTRLADGVQALVDAAGLRGQLALDADALVEVRRRLAADRSGLVETATGEVLFVRCHVAAQRLVIVGAVHITQALAPMAAIAGFEVVVVDPRRAFATPERLPGVTLVTEWPDEALERIGLDAGTAVVTLTHDPKLDDPALLSAVTSPVFYIGALGSPRTHARRIERLTEAGCTADALARIHAPVGLDLGGRTPPEIAVSILAQLVHARHARDRGLAADAGYAPSPPPGCTPHVAALVLAAGMSSRMGAANKLLAAVDGVPMVARAVDAALASRAASVTVVVGHEGDAVAAALAGRAVRIVRNPDYAQGMSTSLRCGLAALPAAAQAVVVLLGDMPRVGAGHVDRLIAAFDPAEPAIIVPEHGGRRGNPVLWPRDLFAAMQAIEGDRGARGLIEAHATRVRRVACDDDGIFFDVDTPADLAGVAAPVVRQRS
ncbi:MAG TPA: XdhC family protein [Rhodocyclaceae bacterium]|nr:XdhC family protein [Rhodocyclaceae bacterium]